MGRLRYEGSKGEYHLVSLQRSGIYSMGMNGKEAVLLIKAAPGNRPTGVALALCGTQQCSSHFSVLPVLFLVVITVS